MGAFGHVVSGSLSLLIIVGVAAMLADGRSLIRAEAAVGDRAYFKVHVSDEYYGIGVSKDSNGRQWTNELHFVELHGCDEHRKIGQSIMAFCICTVVFATFTVLCNLLGSYNGRGIAGVLAAALSVGMALFTVIGFSLGAAFYDKRYNCSTACPPARPFCQTSHKCTAGLTPKTNFNTILCTGVACTDAECCDTRQCNSYSCTSATVPKTNGQLITCPASGCTEATCCNPATCASHTCSAGFTARANPASTQCLLTGCADATCCDPKTCASHACTANRYQARSAPASITCPAAGCSDVGCCDALCGSLTCPAGFARKAAVTDATLCTGAGCLTTCCEANGCASVNCTAVPHKTGTTVACAGATGRTCDAAGCCTVDLCSGYACTAGLARHDAAAIPCPGAGGCTDALCCSSAQCATSAVTCPTGQVKVADTPAVVCPAGTCDVPTCCKPPVTCAGFSCITFSATNKTNHATIPCAQGGCNVATCCDSSAFCSAFSCQDVQNMQNKPNRNTIPCGATASKCTAVVCCDRVVLPPASSCHQKLKFKDVALIGYAVPILAAAFVFSLVNIVALIATGGMKDEFASPEEEAVAKSAAMEMSEHE